MDVFLDLLICSRSSHHRFQSSWDGHDFISHHPACRTLIDGLQRSIHIDLYQIMTGKMYAQPQQLCDSNRWATVVVHTDASFVRLYQVWDGNNRFFLGGRLIFGPDVRSLVFTIFLIVSPVILFCVFVSKRLINEFHHHLGNLIEVIPVVFAAYIIVLLFLTSGRDPGIIPRNPHPPEPEDDSSGLSLELAGNQSNGSTLPPTKDVLVNGTTVKVKYCHTCMLYRPPRCSHCSICNNCVDRLDHHCPWVGQCIGKRNYRFFFMFVSSTTILSIYVFTFCWVNIANIRSTYHCHLWKALGKSPASGILIMYTFLSAWFVGGLTSFHLYLICNNQTTYENFRYRYEEKKNNPYNRGFFHNVREIFFSKIPTVKVNFRAKVKEEDTVSVFPSSLSMGRIAGTEILKTTFDLEMGGKKQGIAAEDLSDILNQIDSHSMALLDRCGTEPRRHANWVSQKNNWEITPEIHVLAA